VVTVVVDRDARARLRAGEPGPGRAGLPADLARGLTHDESGELVLREQHVEVVADESRAVVEAVQHVQQSGTHMRGPAGALGRGMPGEAEQVVALVVTQTQ
jgi:hypothetical protein